MGNTDTIMKKRWIWMLGLCLQSCSNEHQQPSDQLQQKAVPNKYQESYLSPDQMPNEKTQYLKMLTQDMPDNQRLLDELDTTLKAENFILETGSDLHQWVLKDCDSNKIIQLDGEGMRRYSISSTEAMSDHPNTYPEFTLLVFEFPDTVASKSNARILNAALQSGGAICNGKSPNIIAENGREIFYFTTYDVKFTPYIQQYAQFVQKVKVS